MTHSILVVDDEESIRLSLGSVLSAKDVDVETAATMEEAEARLRARRFDLVIADLRLTGVLGIEGLELISYVKEKAPATHVILMTAYGSTEIEAEAHRRGATDYWEKPVPIPTILDKVRSLDIPVDAVREGEA